MPRIAGRDPLRDSRALRRASLALALAVWTLPAASRAGDLTVTLHQIPCPDAATLAEDLRRWALSSMARHPDLHLLLESADPTTITIRLAHADSSEALERSIPFRPSDCPSLGPALRVLLRDWLERDWARARPAPNLPPAAAPDSPAPETRTVLVAAPAPPPLAEPASRAPWAAEALIGAFLPGSQRMPGAAASLAVTHQPGPGWMVGLEAGYQSPVSEEIAIGSVSVELLRIAVTAGAPVLQTSRTRLELATGPALCVLHVRSQGYTENLAKDLFEAAWTAALRWRLALTGRLALVAALHADVRTRSDFIEVVGADRKMAVPPARFTLSTGLSWPGL